MDEELIIDELFVRKHQKDILEVIPKTLSELGLYSPDDWEILYSGQYAIYSLAAQIKLLLGLISSVPQVLCDKTLLKTPIQKVAYLQDMYDSEAQSFVEGGIDLLPTVSNILSVNIISRYLSTGLITAHYFPGYGAKFEKCIKRTQQTCSVARCVGLPTIHIRCGAESPTCTFESPSGSMATRCSSINTPRCSSLCP